LLLLVVLLASACGSNPAKDRRTFLARANSTCTHFQALQNDVRFPTIDPLSARPTHAARAQWGLALGQIVNLGRDEVRALQRLKGPKDLQPRYQKMIDAEARGLDDLAAGADAAKRNHRTEIKAPVTAGRKTLAQASTLAKAIGLPSCE
jgi:hypothetical protein